ncbi:hypothetical protein N665_0044s0018 [Sinapis alba]|nr:hypothetical protein N665_0044s0018 [Sinapis alba]
MDSLELPKRIFTLGEELFLIKSISYHTNDSKLFSAIRDTLHDDEYKELKESRLGVFLKFKEMNFGWASRLLWSLVGADPVRFSLIEFEQITGLNCEYIENLENPRCEVTNEMASFWERIGDSVDAGPSSEQIIRACKRCQEWPRDDRMRLGYLAIFSGFIEGRKVVFKVLIDSLRAKDFTKSYTVDGFIQVLQVWIYHALPELGANYENPLPNKPSPLLLAFEEDLQEDLVKSSRKSSGEKTFELSLPNTRVINYVEKNIEEMFLKWDNDREDVAVKNIIQVMFNAPPNWKWTMNCWEDEGINPWTNPKTHVVYVKKESSVKSLVVREEDIERPSKKACIKDISDARSGAIPKACSEAFIPVTGVDKAYIKNCFKDLTVVMRDGFGTYLKEMKLLGNRMDVVENNLGITRKRTSSDDFQQTTSNLPKKGLEHGSENVNREKARLDEETSSSKALSVEAKEKEVKEGKEKKLKKKVTKGLEKVLVKAKEAKDNEAKANEAKDNEAKANEAKAKVAKEKEEKEAKLAAEDWLGEAKQAEEAKAEETKGKEAADTVLSTEPEARAEASVVLMDKDKDTVSDVKMQEARRLSKRDSALIVVRERSERDRKFAASQQSAFQGNNTTKLIITNTKVGHGYDPFELPDKQLSKAFLEYMKKILFWNSVCRKQNNSEDYPEDLPYEEFKSSTPDHNGLRRRLPGGSWDLYADIVPTFCASNKIWGVDVDDIYAPINFQNDQWLAIWISIPKRHICSAGDCGVYALKYIECHALGYTSFPAAFCERT